MRYLMVVLVLVAGCGRTITEPKRCPIEKIQPVYGVIVNAQGDTVQGVTIYYCGE